MSASSGGDRVEQFSRLEFPSVELTTSMWITPRCNWCGPRSNSIVLLTGNLSATSSAMKPPCSTAANRHACRQASLGQLGREFLSRVHGSAPDIAGLDRANPLAMATSQPPCAGASGPEAKAKPRTSWKRAVDAVLAAGQSHRDLAGSGEARRGCQRMGELVLRPSNRRPAKLRSPFLALADVPSVTRSWLSPFFRRRDHALSKTRLRAHLSTRRNRAGRVEGDSYSPFRAAPMEGGKMAKAQESGREFLALRTGANVFRQASKSCSAPTAKPATARKPLLPATAGRSRRAQRPAWHQLDPRSVHAPWEPISPDNDVLFLAKALQRWRVGEGLMTVAALVDLLIECADRQSGVDSRRSAVDKRRAWAIRRGRSSIRFLRRMPEYIKSHLSQFKRTDINLSRVPTVTPPTVPSAATPLPG